MTFSFGCGEGEEGAYPALAGKGIVTVRLGRWNIVAASSPVFLPRTRSSKLPIKTLNHLRRWSFGNALV
jgi:hypothetical protein